MRYYLCNQKKKCKDACFCGKDCRWKYVTDESEARYKRHDSFTVVVRPDGDWDYYEDEKEDTK